MREPLPAENKEGGCPAQQPLSSDVGLRPLPCGLVEGGDWLGWGWGVTHHLLPLQLAFLMWDLPPTAPSP